MAHNIYFEIPWRELGNTDIIIWINQGRKKSQRIGRLKISKGTLDFYPRKAQKPYKVGWSKVEKMFETYFNS